MSERPLILDLYCGIGGSSMGYYNAGFDVIGVDNASQPQFPFPFFRADALEFLNELRVSGFELAGHKVKAIHASPPCQRFVAIGKGWNFEGFDKFKADLLAPTRELLEDLDGMPYVIENVPGAPMKEPITLCGSMFGLAIEEDKAAGTPGGYLQRHRLFESNVRLMVPGPCNHRGQAIGVYGNGRGGGSMKHRTANADQARRLMGIDWASRTGVAQAVPPAYTEYIGKQLLERL